MLLVVFSSEFGISTKKPQGRGLPLNSFLSLSKTVERFFWQPCELFWWHISCFLTSSKVNCTLSLFLQSSFRSEDPRLPWPVLHLITTTLLLGNKSERIDYLDSFIFHFQLGYSHPALAPLRVQTVGDEWFINLVGSFQDQEMVGMNYRTALVVEMLLGALWVLIVVPRQFNHVGFDADTHFLFCLYYMIQRMFRLELTLNSQITLPGEAAVFRDEDGCCVS